ncbi:dendritic cell-specific transmembrane protein [Trichomycterus rosablanca]|uniref:dendritic cell-specific transmembrane protein n=1 Tax=Trichomycterus rosablanca TaxID=2290929 RepID=UPI002F357B69
MNLRKLIADLRAAWSSICALYTTNNNLSWREKLLLLISCLMTSFILAFLLLLALRIPLQLSIEVCIIITAGFWFFFTLAMCISPSIRCFGILFLMSIGLKQGKKQLLTAGTTVVILLNIQNTLRNLKGLAKSMICNLEEKLIAIDLAPLSNYIRMLKWVVSQLKLGLPDILSDHLVMDFKLNPSVQSGNFTKKITDAHRALNETAESVLGVISGVSSIGKKLYPALGIVLLVITTALYLRRFRSNRKHKNVLITKNFVKYDEKQKLQGKPSVLPLSKKESKHYIIVPSTSLTKKEMKAMLKFSIPIVTHSVAWLFFVGLDALVYWIIVVLSNRLSELEPLHVPVLLKVEKGTFLIGVPIEHDQEVHNFSYNVSVFEKKCLPAPELWLHKSLIPLCFIFTVLLLLVVLSSKLNQLRLIVSEQFYSEDAEKRIAMLHAKILKRRNKWKAKGAKMTWKSFTMQLAFWFPIIFSRQKNDSKNIT